MQLTTTQEIAGYRVVETLGLVRGASIRSRSIVRDIAEWFRNLVGAELSDYTKMMAETREQALDRMRDHARTMGADAVVGVSFATSSIAAGAAELLAYGTAVKLEKV